MSNFLKRLITSLILVPILFFGIFKGDYIFLLFITLVILISFNELSKIIINKDSNQLLLGYILTLSIPIASYIEIELFLNISLFLQFIIHVGVNIRMFPTTGMTLPFLSYGGSSIIGTSILSGIILNLTKKENIS